MAGTSQEIWYAHVGDQIQAVKAVQDACGALNDAKIELLRSIAYSALVDHGVAKE